MRLLAHFNPRLVGAVLEGTADQHSPVQLHVFEDSPDAVAGFLRDHGIATETRTRTLRLDRQRSVECPVLLFEADSVAIDLTVFPRDALRQAPLGQVDTRPCQRISLATLETMLADNA